MVAALLAIWDFLVAWGPWLIASLGVLADIGSKIFEATKSLAALAIIATALELIFDPNGRQRVGNLVYNIVAGGIRIATKALKDSSPELEEIVKAFANGFQNLGPTLTGIIAPPIGELARANIANASAGLTIGGESTPANAIDQAALAFQQAFGFGMSSGAVTALFEAMFPEKLNVLNATGVAFAKMAGFDEVTHHVIDPLYENAFGTALRYHYRGLFKPEFASEDDAVKWHSRRLLSDADLREVFGVSGLKAKYEQAFVESAYRPVPPFLLARAAEAGALPQDQLTETLQFAGFRDIDISRLEAAYAALALQPYERTYLSTAERAVELGYETPLYLQNVMNTLNLNAEMQNLVQLTVAERRADNLTVLYKKSISEAYRYGQITDSNYVSSLEAVGIEPAEANALYAVDSIAKQGKALVAEQRAEARIAAQRTRAAMQAAIAQYRTDAIDAIALEAALIAAGVDPQIASFAVVVQEARKTGPKVFVYGQEMSRGAALQLREKVAALAKQSTAKLITYDQALSELHALGIPDANALALTAAWFATTTTPARVGVREPI